MGAKNKIGPIGAKNAMIKKDRKCKNNTRFIIDDLKFTTRIQIKG